MRRSAFRPLGIPAVRHSGPYPFNRLTVHGCQHKKNRQQYVKSSQKRVSRLPQVIPEVAKTPH